ncbi:hypothetical protein [uncultured Roseibium sp.]|uniref:hypothetical protein n=1 Tax=uncultured Roseibium sp. TaxID=1936171 RepID=UPI00262BC0ED|nr:hypothetical protein [uncultured Roseibium sp.]
MPDDNKERGYYSSPGCYGALAPVTLPFSPGETNTFYWSGLFTWSAPGDLITPCEGLSAGRFEIHAQFYRDINVPVVGWPTRSESTRLQQSATSHPFDLKGDIDMSRLEYALNSRAVSFVWDMFELPNSGSVLQDALTSMGEMKAIGDGYYCLTKEIPLLFSGVVEACTAEPVVTALGLRMPPGDYISVRGKGVATKNVVQFRKALVIARDAVSQPLLSGMGLSSSNRDRKRERCQSSGKIWCRGRVAYTDDASELMVSIQNWAVSEKDEMWLFHLQFRTSEQYKTQSEGDSFVCVDKSGKVLRIANAERGSRSAKRLHEAFHNKTFACLQ